MSDLPVWQGFFEDGHRAYFAPEDGALLLYRSHDDDVLMWLHDWHTHLLGGETGEEVLGVFGWIALGLLLTGLYLWWPGAGSVLAHLKMYAGPPVRRWLSWHRSSGALLLPLLLLATLTGVGMVYSQGLPDACWWRRSAAKHSSRRSSPARTARSIGRGCCARPYGRLPRARG